MLAILLALVSFISWGTGDIFGTLASRKIGTYLSTLYLLIFLIPVYLFAVFLFPAGLENLTIGTLLLTITIGIIGAIGLLTFYEGLRRGIASVVVTISATFPAIVVILSIIFLKEKITLAQAAVIFLILLGVVISTLDISEIKKRKLKLDAGVIYAIITALLWGIYWTFIKIPVEQIGWAWPNLLTMSGLPLVYLVTKIKKVKIYKNDFWENKYILILNSACLGVGSIALNYAIKLGGNVSIITPIAGSYPVLFVILSFFIFKDKISKPQIIGVITTLCGIVLLSFLSV